MKFIKPSEISARILTLLDESDERVILVSPYMKISKWHRFIKKVNGLNARKIKTEIYIRDDPENEATFRDLDRLELKYKKIPHLHSKLYMNERCGIVTSMNLLLSSDINSLEIGYATETWTEYNELLDYYYRYIRIGEPVQSSKIEGLPVTDLNEFMRSISEELKRSAKNAWLWLAENALHISTGPNNYSISINDGYLRITACLNYVTHQKKVQYPSLIVKKIRDLTAMKVDILPGPKTEILKLSGQSPYILKSTFTKGILESEAAYMLETVIRFIDATDDLVFKKR